MKKNRGFMPFLAPVAFTVLLFTCKWFDYPLDTFYAEQTGTVALLPVTPVAGTVAAGQDGYICIAEPGAGEAVTVRIPLNNPQNLGIQAVAVSESLPLGVTVIARQTADKSAIEIIIGGAAAGQEFPLTLLLKTEAEGRILASQVIPVSVISFETRLEELKINEGDFTQTFDPVLYEYTKTVDSGTETVTIRGKAAGPAATVTINGQSTVHELSKLVGLQPGGNNITVRVSAPHGVSYTDYRAIVTRSISAANVLGGSVSIAGTARAGQVLTAGIDGLSPAGISQSGTFYYRWFRGAAVFPVKEGSDAHQYTLTLDDVGQSVKVEVSCIGYTGTVTSGPTAAVAGYSIGDTGPGGGKVFYVDDGTYGGGTWTYLEVSPDIGEASWASFYDEDVTTGTAIGSGKSNTAAIQLAISGFSASAAGICTSYAGGGKNDWFLPSKDELNQIYQNRSLLGSFPAGFYWSSSEYAGYAAWRQDFSNGTQYATGRGNSYHVRAVRSF